MELKIAIYIDDTLRATRTVNTPCTIGRSKTMGLTVSHPAVSRKHCELFDLDGMLWLRDHGSLNGTHYNGEMIEEEVLLADNDEFNIGEILFRVEVLPAADEPANESPVELADSGDDSANTMVGMPDPLSQHDNDDLRLADD